jgi:hypothetical protein
MSIGFKFIPTLLFYFIVILLGCPIEVKMLVSQGIWPKGHCCLWVKYYQSWFTVPSSSYFITSLTWCVDLWPSGWSGCRGLSVRSRWSLGCVRSSSTRLRVCYRWWVSHPAGADSHSQCRLYNVQSVALQICQHKSMLLDWVVNDTVIEYPTVMWDWMCSDVQKHSQAHGLMSTNAVFKMEHMVS